MISLGSVRWTDGSPKINLDFAYEKRRSGADMQYRAMITVSSVSGYSWFGYPIYFNLTIGSELRESITLKAASPSQWSSPITYTSGWYTVANKTTGTTPVSFNVYSGLGCSRSGTYGYNMEVDPAGSGISAPGGTVGIPLTLTLTRYNTSFTDTVTWACGSMSGTVCTNTKDSYIAWNNTNGNTEQLASQNTMGQYVEVTFTVTTRSSTGAVVGTNSTKASLIIPNIIAPSVELTVEDAAGYYDTYNAYVQGYSKLKITANPTLAYGSPITAYAITADGASYATSPVTTEAIQGKGILPVTAKVTDARNHPSRLVSKDVTVLEYVKPVVNLSAYRCNSSGTADPEGAYMRIEVTSTISDLNGKNRAAYKVVYRGGTLTGSGTSFTSDVLACDVSYTHSIEVTITDNLSSTTKAAVIPIAFTLIDYYETGKGISFGKVGTREGFDCAMEAYFGGNRLQEVGSPESDSDAVNVGYLKNNGLVSTTWVEWANVDNTKAPGWYCSKPTSAVSFGGISWSAAVWFRVDAYDSNALCQTFYLASADGYIARRQCNGGTWGALECVNPPLFTNTEYRTTERYMGKPVYVLMKDLGSLPNAGSKTVENLATHVDTIVDAILTTANSDATYFNAREVSWYVGSYGWPYCVMITSTDMSAYTARLKIKYTKTTD